LSEIAEFDSGLLGERPEACTCICSKVAYLSAQLTTDSCGSSTGNRPRTLSTSRDAVLHGRIKQHDHSLAIARGSYPRQRGLAAHDLGTKQSEPRLRH